MATALYLFHVSHYMFRHAPMPPSGDPHNLH